MRNTMQKQWWHFCKEAEHSVCVVWIGSDVEQYESTLSSTRFQNELDRNINLQFLM